MQGLTVVAPFLGILGLIVAYLIFLYVKKQPNGTPLMQDLEGMIHTGAMTFLKREYSVLVFFIAIVFDNTQPFPNPQGTCKRGSGL